MNRPSVLHARPREIRTALVALLVGAAAASGPAAAQEPASWGADLVFHTFSIAAVDPETGESGVAVTTRVACVGNGVPWVRAGVGAVATQAATRVEYGEELLDLLQDGVDPREALDRLLAADEAAPRRQVGVIAVDGRSAQHTGAENNAWAGNRSGAHFVTQGNLLVGPEVLDAVARTFEASEGSPRHLADRLVEALAAGQAAGGDARKGRPQSAALVVADPRPGVARRPDGLTVQINVCEHETPVAELRRVYETVSQTLGYRTLSRQTGGDVLQLKIVLQELGYYRPGQDLGERGRGARLYDAETADAVDRFRADQGLSTPADGSPPGLVDGAVVELLWERLEAIGRADAVRRRLLDLTRIRR